MNCPICGTTMKPLLTSEYCPNDCDRIVETYIPPEITEKIPFRWSIETTGTGIDFSLEEDEVDEWIKAVDEFWQSHDNSTD